MHGYTESATRLCHRKVTEAGFRASPVDISKHMRTPLFGAGSRPAARPSWADVVSLTSESSWRRSLEALLPHRAERGPRAPFAARWLDAYTQSRDRGEAVADWERPAEVIVVDHQCAEASRLPLCEVGLEPQRHSGHRALRQVCAANQRLQRLANPSRIRPRQIRAQNGLVDDPPPRHL